MSSTILKPIVSELRSSIIKGVAGKLEKYGLNESGVITVRKPLSEFNDTIRANLEATFEAIKVNDKSSYLNFIQNTARTYMHILICFKVLEKRGLMHSVIEEMIDVDIYDEILPDFISVNPIAFDEFIKKYDNEINEFAKKDGNEEELEYYQLIFLIDKMSEVLSHEVRILFDESEYNLIRPDFDDMKQILGIINKIDAAEYFEDDFLGWIYQYWVDVSDDEKKSSKKERDFSYANNIYDNVLSTLESEQSENGEFYTPRWVVKYVVDNTLGHCIGTKPVEKITLLDPACGAGNYLVYAFDVFYSQYKKEHSEWSDSLILESIIANNIHGVDIQREPLQIAALNLWIKSKVISNNSKIKKVNLYKTNILQTSSLYHWENESDEFVQLSLFEEINDMKEKKYTADDIGKNISLRESFETDKAKKLFKKNYDVIVMNPPFVDTRNMAEEQKELLKEEYPNNSRNLASAFMERAHELCSSNGYIGFIASDTFMSIQSFEYIRTQLLLRKLKKIVRLGLNVFDGPLVHAVIFVYKNSNVKKNKVEIIDLRKENDKALHMQDEPLLKNQSDFEMIKGVPFIYEMSEKLWNNISSAKTLDEAPFYDDILTGLQTGNVKKYTRYIWEVPTKEIGNQWLIYEKGESVDYLREPNLVVDWSEEAQNFYMTSKSARSNYLASYFSENNKKYFLKKGISYNLTSGTGLGNDRFNARIFKEGQIFSADTPTLFVDDEWYSYTLGLLNSNFVSYMLKLFNPTIHFTKYDLTRIPYIEPSFEQKEEIDENIYKMINAMKEKELIKETLFETINSHMDLNKSISEYVAKYKELVEEIHKRKINNDKYFYDVYGLEKVDIQRMEDDYARKVLFEEREIDEYWIAIHYLRTLCVECLKNGGLMTVNELINKIRIFIEDKFKNSAYLFIESLEMILGGDLQQILTTGARKDGITIQIFGKGQKDILEHDIATKVIGGKGKNKEIVFWFFRDYLIEYIEDKRYSMQNEIRRLTDEIYLPKLQRSKEKLQNNSLNSTEQKQIENDIALYAECVKTLENWKVVD